ncbi:kinase-like protein [Mycena belliarum]|uniref:non-specific serine/threonine protein kinase n=1 Tax=Mycena belliarum TaxID=1033014 RepID=A0AAD6TS50_9AGAR|nr:kinase-like protein [Mycena belliae]
MEPSPASRRPPVRMNAQDGPWSVSVAETPDDARSYSLYIKTPTHNLTLTRTTVEIVELHRKLREAHPSAALPDLPVDASAPKRKTKSTFLNTLSRLASPNANRVARRPNGTSPGSGGGGTPIVSPQAEANDPFLSFGHSDAPPTIAAPPVSGKSTALAAYLTTVSNTPALRQARVWKRFVHVRTDDLESVRVERAIKRVRSDLASHTGGGLRNKENIAVEKSIVEDHEASLPPTPSPATEPTPSTTAPPANAEKPVDAAGEAPPTSPIAAANHDGARIPRSQSADPDKSSRLSRAFSNTADEQTDPEEQTSSQAGETDDSSISTTGHDAGAPKKRASKKKLRAISIGARKSTRKVVIDDFEMMRVLGKGCAGKVLLVKHKTTTDLYALKAITKRHVLAHQELQHTLTEQAVLKRMAAESRDPFVVKLWWSFHDKENLFLVMDFHPGGDLATQLARWGRLGRDRARFYAAEIVEGVEGLHAAGVIYRDLKPENILIGGDGHIVLTDFGLSKEFPRRTTAITAPSTPSAGGRSEFYSAAGGAVVSANGSTVPATPPWMKAEKGGELAAGWPGPPVGQAADTTTTFCGTAEYLAPEVIQGLAYSYEVDWWSFGTMLYEMLTGITPFWANNHSDMYVRVLQDELQFPDDRAIDQDTKSLIRGLLQRNPALRICEPRIKRHPYFSMIDWSHVYYKRYIPPYIPPIDPSNASDTQNFDDTFLDMEPVLDDINDDSMDTDQEPATDAERTDGEDEANTTPSQSRSSSLRPRSDSANGAEDDSVDVFDGYSFKGRHSVLIDDDDDEESDGSGEEESEEEGDILRDLDVGLEPDTPKVAVEAESEAEPTLEGETEDIPEPKTPEARPVVAVEPVPELPAGPVVDGITEEARTPEATAAPVAAPLASAPAEPKPRRSKETHRPSEKELPAPEVPPKATKSARTTRPRREKSGVPALDRHMEDAEATEKEDDDEDDDWDFVEAADGEDRNGAKATSLFARGVVDRYRLAVFRKASTPSQTRPVSGVSPEAGASGAEGDSPSPSQRRGRTGAGLTFRKHPRQFLRPKSPPPPPSSFSSKSSLAGKSMTRSNSATISAASSSGGLLTPATSAAGSPSLKSKESAMSMGAQSSSSGENGHGALLSDGAGKVPGSPPESAERTKSKKLKKYKENAEKVFHFLSPRQPL